ncbi:MAG: phosphotransferase [Demequinaceae bacterium]|nr:phosphotransferase [Demequinaceae bacterium]
MGGDPEDGTRRVEISDELAAALVREQHPDLAELDISRRYVFDDHLTIRLGDDLCLNLPTVPGLGDAMVSAAEWLDLVSAEWSFPAGTPVRLGEPTADYPFPWQISHWVPGSNAAILPFMKEAAKPLGDALRQVHTTAPAWAPASEEAGTPLSRHRKTWHILTALLRDAIGPRGNRIDPALLSVRWEKAVDTVIDSPSRWTHGNLDPRYVVSNRGLFGGIGSWWTFGAGDPAADIAAAFLLIHRDDEAAFLESYGQVSRATRERIAGYWLLRVLRYATSSNPFLWRLGWARLDELIRLGDLD